jgi:error-prone DNA polymerase
VVMTSRLLLARGMIQRSPEGIVHLVADQLVDRTGDLDHLGPRPPALPLARADEVARPGRDGYIAPRHPRDTRVIPKSRDFR